MNIEKLTGAQLKKARRRLRWNEAKVSQRMVAEKIGCSTTTINLIENDKVIRGENKWAYAHLLGLL
jgi:DNA-binding XRE family transcriptional regulator